jgi:hypothetical protein
LVRELEAIAMSAPRQRLRDAWLVFLGERVAVPPVKPDPSIVHVAIPIGTTVANVLRLMEDLGVLSGDDLAPPDFRVVWPVGTPASTTARP